MKRLFVDTSGWYAFLVINETFHESIQSILLSGQWQLLTSNTVFSELFTLLVARGHESVAISFGEKLRTGKFCTLLRVSESDEEKAWQILKERRGRGLSYVDALSVAMVMRMRISALLTLDQGLREFGFEILP